MEMMPKTEQKSICVEHLATEEKPFHFEDSGLPNVFLVGIKYFTYEDGRVVPEIPAVKQLVKLIARDLIERPDALSGEEIRFLRKRLGKRAVDFSKELGIDAATLSRLENGKQEPGESLDKLVRLVYAVTSDDPALVDQIRPMLDSLLASWKAGPANGKIVKKIDDNNEWKDVPLAA
jgi:transcriptional regulator with XRE-family HTH domain